jgi:hypothetical protein
MFRLHKVLIVSLLLLLAPRHAPAQTPSLKTLMRAKLANTQRLLESLATADYAAIQRDADALSRITEKEIVSWQMGVQPEYAKQATFFVLSVRGLQEAAASRNIDAALHEYTTLISSCVHCHAHVRRAKSIAYEPRPRR